MAWLRKIPGLSLILLLLTYAAEGWIYASWVTLILEETTFFSQLNESYRFSAFYGLAVAAIVFFVFLFTSPTSLITVGLDNWLKSDTRAFISIFIGAFAFAIIVQRVDYFARFLVLAGAAFLLKLDLQLLGYSRWFCSIILAFLCWLGFSGGILAFYTW